MNIRPRLKIKLTIARIKTGLLDEPNEKFNKIRKPKLKMKKIINV